MLDLHVLETPRRIAHLDMDAFYASVELLRRPDLKGLPVAIGGRGDPSSRGVVTTATYEARAFGVHSGMALSRAARLCPQLIFLPVDFERYREMSRRFKQAILTLVPCMEDRGIDEVYLDLTAIEGSSTDIAQRLQQLVFDATGLSCSIGIGPNKLIAKIASDLDKPRGISIVAAEDFATRLGPLPARKIPGIGPKADQTLEALGIRTIEQLAACEEALLNQHFTPRYSRWLWRVARGLDDRPLELDPEPRSRSRETTFEQDLHPVRHWDTLARTLIRLSEQVSADLAKRRYAGRTVGIKLRTSDFKSLTRDRTVDRAVHRAGDITVLAFECLGRAIHGANTRHAKTIRLLGVRVGELVPLSEAVSEPASEAEPVPPALQDPNTPPPSS